MPVPRFQRSLPVSLAIVAFAFGAPLAHGQEARPFHALVFTSGATTMKVDGLNGMLTNAHFAGLSNDGISYGLTGYYAYGRAMLGADVSHVTYGEEGLSNGRSDDLNATQLLATASYAIVANGRVNVFPQLGIGTGRFDVTLRDRSGETATTQSQPTFDEVAQSPGQSTMVSGHHLLYSVGGGADFLIARRSSDKLGVVFGVRGGYLVAPNRTTWTSSGHPVITGPDASAGGPFLRIVVGVGGR
ncbi:hypothetical protein BH09GEM1_BH09GEM1_26360 [soil metagenome]